MYIGDKRDELFIVYWRGGGGFIYKRDGFFGLLKVLLVKC